MAKLLISKSDDQRVDGAIIGVFPNEHTFGRMESKQRFEEHFGAAEQWHGKFIIVIVDDFDAGSLHHLMETNDEGYAKKFSADHVSSEKGQDLDQLGQCNLTAAELSAAVFDRG